MSVWNRVSSHLGWSLGQQCRKLMTSSTCLVRAPPLNKVKNQQLEPTYLTPKEMMVPVYPLLNIQMHAYDFALLENYAKWVHRTLRALDIQVEDCWATPHRSARVTRLKPNSAVVETTYELNTYERNVQLNELPTTVAPLVADLLQQSTPSGVWLRVQPHERAYDERRYVPDLELRDLKLQLSEVGMDPDKRKRKPLEES